jgi:hypothetical protein
VVHFVYRMLADCATRAGALPLGVALATAVSNRRHYRGWRSGAIKGDLVSSRAGVEGTSGDLMSGWITEQLTWPYGPVMKEN